jgi:hypothetical protein
MSTALFKELLLRVAYVCTDDERLWAGMQCLPKHRTTALLRASPQPDLLPCLPSTLCPPPCAVTRSRQHPPSSPLVSTAAGTHIPVLPASAWQLGALEADTGLEGATHGASSSGSGVASTDEEMPALDLALLCGRAILPGNLALLLQEGDPRR